MHCNMELLHFMQCSLPGVTEEVSGVSEALRQLALKCCLEPEEDALKLTAAGAICCSWDHCNALQQIWVAAFQTAQFTSCHWRGFGGGARRRCSKFNCWCNLQFGPAGETEVTAAHLSCCISYAAVCLFATEEKGSWGFKGSPAISSKMLLGATRGCSKMMLKAMKQVVALKCCLQLQQLCLKCCWKQWSRLLL